MDSVSPCSAAQSKRSDPLTKSSWRALFEVIAGSREHRFVKLERVFLAHTISSRPEKGLVTDASRWWWFGQAWDSSMNVAVVKPDHEDIVKSRTLGFVQVYHSERQKSRN